MIGLQPFCVAAVDNHGQTSDQYCVMIMVNSGNPSFDLSPTYILNTAAPIGTVMSTQTRFSVRLNCMCSILNTNLHKLNCCLLAPSPLRRTTMENTFIYIRRRDTGSTIYTIDCKTSPDVYFINKTIVFFVPSTYWTPGRTYYVSMTEGVATADQYCGIEGDGYPNSNSSFEMCIYFFCTTI